MLTIYRLVDYKVGTLVAGTVPVPVTQTAYNLDEVGNWDSKTTDSVTENRTHNAANEITQIDATAITSDDNGNLIQDASYDYTFDENNRLVLVEQASVPVASYAYDALGRRISKVVGSATIVFLYDNARIIEERDGSNNVQATYTYGNYIDEVLTKDAGANKYYYHQNTLWSVHALTDAAGAVVERYTYDAYGAISVLDPLYVPLSSAPLAYFTFTGREYDAETGLYHYRARTYGAGLGRFYSRDPLGYVDGMNLYEYVASSPVNLTDATGSLSVKPDVGANLGLAAGCGKKSAQKWNFVVDEGKHCSDGGWIVQQVELKCAISGCDASDTCKAIPPTENTSTYWEAWEIPDNNTVPMDIASRMMIDKKCGSYNQVGTIKYYCKSDVAGDSPANWEKGKSYGNGDCSTKTADSQPSTDKKPQWWDNNPKDGPATRQFNSNWCCCCPNKTANATASPD